MNRMNSIDIYPSKPKIIVQTCVGVTFMLAGIYFAWFPGNNNLVKLIISLFAPTVIYILVKRMLSVLREKKPSISISSDHIVFQDGKVYKVIYWSKVKGVGLERIVSNQNSRNIIKLELIDGTIEEVMLNDLNFNWEELEREVKGLKRDFDRQQNIKFSDEEHKNLIRGD